MTQAKFTKGPWMLEYGEVKHRPSSIRAIEGGVSILRANAFCRVAAKETRANAHLMVAAPDMYEALEQILGNVEVARFHLHRTEESEIFSSSLFDTINQAREALAKARGES